MRTHLVECFGGQEPSAASVTFLGLEPIEVLRFASDDVVHYVTLGCSRHAMTDPADPAPDPVRGPRAEVVLALHGGAGVASGVYKSLALLAAAPAVEGVVLRPDGLVDLGEELWHQAPFTAVLLGACDIPDLALPAPADPVVFLEAVPLTATEAAWVRLRGAKALRVAWAEAGIDVRDPHRGAAAL